MVVVRDEEKMINKPMTNASIYVRVFVHVMLRVHGKIIIY